MRSAESTSERMTCAKKSIVGNFTMEKSKSDKCCSKPSKTRDFATEFRCPQRGAHVALFLNAAEEAFREQVCGAGLRLHHAVRSVWGVHSG